MLKSEPVRFGLIGCGRIAQSHIEAFARVPDARLVAIAEPREAAGKAAAEGARARHFSDYRDPEVAGLVDALIVCAPPSEHPRIVEHFLQLGKHVLCEKPLTIRSSEAVELARIAQQKGMTLMMASKFRYTDDMIQAKAIIEAGTLGNVLEFENVFTGKVAMKERWNCDPKISGGGVLIDNGSHSVDIARYLLGPLAAVQAQPGVQGQGLSVEDSAYLWLRTANGVMGTVDLSWTIHKESPWYVSVYGSAGTLNVGWQSSQYRHDGSAGWVKFGNGYDKVAAFSKQLQNFVDTLRGSAAPLMGIEDALASVRVVEAAYKSIGTRTWVPVGSGA